MINVGYIVTIGGENIIHPFNYTYFFEKTPFPHNKNESVWIVLDRVGKVLKMAKSCEIG